MYMIRDLLVSNNYTFCCMTSLAQGAVTQRGVPERTSNHHFQIGNK